MMFVLYDALLIFIVLLCVLLVAIYRARIASCNTRSNCNMLRLRLRLYPQHMGKDEILRIYRMCIHLSFFWFSRYGLWVWWYLSARRAISSHPSATTRNSGPLSLLNRLATSRSFWASFMPSSCSLIPMLSQRDAVFTLIISRSGLEPVTLPPSRSHIIYIGCCCGSL